MNFPRTLHDCTPTTDPRNSSSTLPVRQSITCLALEKEEVEETVRICKDIRPDVKTKAAVVDVTDFKAVMKLVKEVVEEFGSIDVLAMNAGRPPQWLKTDISDSGIWCESCLFQSTAPFFAGACVCTCAVLPFMKKQKGGGRIIYTSSSGAHLNSGMGSYIIGKLGQVCLAEINDAENKNDNIKCFAFHPGCIKTRFYLNFEDEVEGREKRMGEKESAEMAVGTLKGVEFDTPHMAAGLVTKIAAGELDFMSGRYLDAAVDVQRYVEMREEIVSKDLCRVRLNEGNGELVPRLDD
ncbi:NAD(P)-binding protein [Acephala macrosclerotiorum]|nr:NAD(P)-binding protein [Acephala macrosclerotiorum]